VSPFFDDRYTSEVLRSGRKEWWRFGSYLTRRLLELITAHKYDLVVIYSELVPYLPELLERTLAKAAVPFVLDFADAFFHAYDQHRIRPLRWLLGSKIPGLMRHAALNVAGSEYLAGYARQFSRHVAVIPTVVDLSRFPVGPVASTDSTFRIGWIGSPATTPHLRSMLGELADFCTHRDVEVVAIGAKRFNARSVPVRWVEWSESTEVRELSRTDVGIMPLPSTPWAAGKGGFKLIQAMACWRPVVASPVGENIHIVENKVSGLHAGPGQWSVALDRLYHDHALRTRLGTEGRYRVERDFSLQVWAPKLAALWTQAALNGPR
jgi:glycosyltransferase involved in cell wall biosynthesis